MENLLIGFSAISIGKCQTGAHPNRGAHRQVVHNGKLRQSYQYKVPLAYRGEVDPQENQFYELLVCSNREFLCTAVPLTVPQVFVLLPGAFVVYLLLAP